MQQLAGAHLERDGQRGNAAVCQHGDSHDRLRVAVVGDLPRSVGGLDDVTAGQDRALTGMQTQRATQVLDDPYGNRDADNWFNPRGLCAAGDWHVTGIQAATRIRYGHPAGESIWRWCGCSGSSTHSGSKRGSRRSMRSTGSGRGPDNNPINNLAQ